MVLFSSILLSSILANKQCALCNVGICDSGHCLDAAPGSFRTELGAFIACSPGRFSAEKSAVSCTACARGRFQPLSGATFCEICETDMPHSTTLEEESAAAAACVCRTNYMLVGGGTDVDNTTTQQEHQQQRGVCDQCPSEGYNCSEPGQTIEDVELMPGFWRGGTNTKRALQCSNWPQACRGGRMDEQARDSPRRSQDFFNCARGYCGPRCTVCEFPEFGNHKNLFFGAAMDYACVECTEGVKHEARTKVIAFVAGYGVLAFALLKKKNNNKHFTRDFATRTKNSRLFHGRRRCAKFIVGGLEAQRRFWKGKGALCGRGHDFDSAEEPAAVDNGGKDAEDGKQYRTRKLRKAGNMEFITQKLKTVVSFSQVITAFGSAFKLELPEEVKRFLVSIKFLSFDLFAFFDPGCLLNMDYLVRTLLICLVPIGVVLAGLCSEYACYKLGIFREGHSRKKALARTTAILSVDMKPRVALPGDTGIVTEPRERTVSDKWKRASKMWRLARHASKQFSQGPTAGFVPDSSLYIFLVVSFATYTSVTLQLGRFFDCESFDDGSNYVMVADAGVSCDSEMYANMRPFIQTMTFVFPFGVPLAYFLLLLKVRKDICDPKQRNELLQLSELDVEERLAFFQVVLTISDPLDAPDFFRDLLPQGDTADDDSDNGHRSGITAHIMRCSIARFAAMGNDTAGRERRIGRMRLASKLSFLWGAYEPKFWFWEVLDMLRKVIVLLIPFSIDNQTQEMAFGIFFMFMSCLVYLRCSPFLLDSDDVLTNLSLGQLFLQLMVGVLITLKTADSNEKMEADNQRAFSVVMIGTVTLVLLTGLAEVLYGFALEVEAEIALSEEQECLPDLFANKEEEEGKKQEEEEAKHRKDEERLPRDDAGTVTNPGSKLTTAPTPLKAQAVQHTSPRGDVTHPETKELQAKQTDPASNTTPGVIPASAEARTCDMPGCSCSKDLEESEDEPGVFYCQRCWDTIDAEWEKLHGGQEAEKEEESEDGEEAELPERGSILGARHVGSEGKLADKFGTKVLI
jgi:hypothetical protein